MGENTARNCNMDLKNKNVSLMFKKFGVKILAYFNNIWRTDPKSILSRRFDDIYRRPGDLFSTQLYPMQSARVGI